MKLEDLEVYNISMDLADKIWYMVEEWDYLKRTLLVNN